MIGSPKVSRRRICRPPAPCLRGCRRNADLPANIRSLAHVEVFTGDPTNGQFGLFPFEAPPPEIPELGVVSSSAQRIGHSAHARPVGIAVPSGMRLEFGVAHSPVT